MALVRGWRWYLKLLDKAPYSTAMVSTGILMASGDIIAQKIIEEKPDWDSYRTRSFALIGIIFFGPAVTRWYKFLDKLVPYLGVAKPVQGVAKVCFDQGFFAPFALFMFIGLSGSLKGQTFATISLDYSRDYKEILLNNYKFWPFVQIFNFYIIPLQHRLMFVNVAAIFWNTYLSWRSNLHNLTEQTMQESLPNVDVGNYVPSQHPRGPWRSQQPVRADAQSLVQPCKGD